MLQEQRGQRVTIVQAAVHDQRDRAVCAARKPLFLVPQGRRLRPAQGQCYAFAEDLTDAAPGPVRETCRHPPQCDRIDRCSVKSNDPGKSRQGNRSLKALVEQTTAFAGAWMHPAFRPPRGRTPMAATDITSSARLQSISTFAGCRGNGGHMSKDPVGARQLSS